MKYETEVFAAYDRESIRVYQAFCPAITEEAVRLQRFGAHYNFNRMTWVKPSFLWMMYRSGWGTKKNQECILALDVRREAFDALLRQAVLTSPDAHADGADWERQFSETAVYCQWDPDRSIKGAPIQRAAIQLGLRGEALRHFLDTGILRITDLTPQVRKWNERRKSGRLTGKDLPTEKRYPVTDKKIRQRLAML